MTTSYEKSVSAVADAKTQSATRPFCYGTSPPTGGFNLSGRRGGL